MEYTYYDYWKINKETLPLIINLKEVNLLRRCQMINLSKYYICFIIMYRYSSSETEFWAIINDCKSLFTRLYQNSTIEFVWRRINETAREVTKAATLSASFHILIEPPSCIEHILINEML